jgi:prepilin-type N-terminal cleavage/methylation domain-containing protein/prepilin-type processing-associated H-X9-DG protein
MRTRQRAAFTLVELLVVIGIIAVLIAILLPALTRARAQANVVKCAANLQQMGQGIQIYITQSKGKMPLAWQRRWSAPPLPNAVGQGRGWTMFGLLLEVARIPMKVFRCPADTRNYTLTEAQFYMPFDDEIIGWETKFPFDYTVMVIGYTNPARRIPWSVAWDDTVIPNKGPLDAARVKSPAIKMLVWDGYCAILTVGGGVGGGANFFLDWDGLGPYPLWVPTVFRHDRTRGPNCLFADGHVETKIDWTPLKTRPAKDDYFTMPYYR